MAEKAHLCPCTDRELPQFEWVSTLYPIASKVLKALHNNGILTDTECGKCANTMWNWHKLTAIVVAAKPPGVVQQALVVLQEQAAIQYHSASIKALARLLKVLSALYKENMVTEQEVEDLKVAVRPWKNLVHIQYAKPPDVVTRTVELLDETKCYEKADLLRVLSTLYQEKMVTEQELEDLKPTVLPWSHLICIQSTKPPDVVTRTAELLAEAGSNEANLLRVLAALHQKTVITQHDLHKWKGDACNMLVNLIRDQYTKAAENVGTTADVLHIFGCTKEAKMLRMLSALYQKKTIADSETDVDMCHLAWESLMKRGYVMNVNGVGEVLCLGLVNIQCSKSSEVVTTMADVLDEFGLKEEATQLRVLSEMYQERLISEDDLRYCYMKGYSYRHWLDSLVLIQSSKSYDVCARTFDTLQRYSLTEVAEERQTECTGITKYHRLKPSYSSSSEAFEELPSSNTMKTLEEWRRLSECLLSKGHKVPPSTADVINTSQYDEVEMSENPAYVPVATTVEYEKVYI